ERLTSEGRGRGAKLMGGSVELYDLVLIASKEAGLTQHTTDLIELVGRAYQTPQAEAIGLTPGVDNDDHNELVEDGCGYQEKRAELLRENFGVEVGSQTNMVNPFLLGIRAHLE